MIFSYGNVSFFHRDLIEILPFFPDFPLTYSNSKL